MSIGKRLSKFFRKIGFYYAPSRRLELQRWLEFREKQGKKSIPPIRHWYDGVEFKFVIEGREWFSAFPLIVYPIPGKDGYIKCEARPESVRINGEWFIKQRFGKTNLPKITEGEFPGPGGKI